MVGTILTVLAVGAVVSDCCKGGKNDTVVKRGDTFFRGRYKTTSGRCYRCDGTGRVHGKPCRKCGGTGQYEHTTWYR